MTSAAGYTELCTLSGLPGFGTAMPSGQRAAAANAPGLAVGGATSGMTYEHAVIIFLLLRLQYFFYVYSFSCS